VLTNKEIFKGKKVCLVVSGGNVDREVYQSLITGNAQPPQFTEAPQQT